MASFSTRVLKGNMLLKMMILIASVWIMASGVTATVPVQAPTKTSCLSVAPTNSAFMPSVFGVSKRLPPPSVLVRGGAVAEPDTLEDVEAAILKASSEEKLVVIDFSATWCGPCKMISPLVRYLSSFYFYSRYFLCCGLKCGSHVLPIVVLLLCRIIIVCRTQREHARSGISQGRCG